MISTTKLHFKFESRKRVNLERTKKFYKKNDKLLFTSGFVLPNFSNNLVGSGCGSVGRAVASNTKVPRFKSSHWQKFIYIEHLFTVNYVLKRQK